MNRENATPAPMAMLRLLTGSWVSQALYVAARLGIADLLRDGPQPCGRLAEATGAQERALYRVLRALASLGVFAEDDEKRFRLTPLAECLCADMPGSLRAFAIMLGEPEHWRPWGEIWHSVSTGRPAFDRVFGLPHFQHLSRNPQAARVFDEAMTSRSGQENEAIVAAYDFSGLECVVDIGGGQGSLLASILRVTPSTKAILFDVPHVIATARTVAREAGPGLLWEFKAGDFFEGVPAGGDAYILKKVIHDWDDGQALAILRSCRAALSPTGRLLLIEPVIPVGNEPSFNKLLDLLMLVWSGGQERTEAEHRTLLTSAGLDLARTIPTRSPLTILEAVPR